MKFILSIFLLLFSSVSYLQENQKDESPVIKAVTNSDYSLLKKMMSDSDLDLNQRNKDGETPLMIAAKKGDTRVVKMLLDDERTDPFLTNNFGATAYKLAFYANKHEVMKILGELEEKKKMQDLRRDIAKRNPELAKQLEESDRILAESDRKLKDLKKGKEDMKGTLIESIKGLLGSILTLLVTLITLISIGRVYKKAGQRAWAVVVPVYNFVVSLRVAGISPWIAVLMTIGFLLPVVSNYLSSYLIMLSYFLFILIPYVFIQFLTAKRFSKGFFFGLGLFVLPFIFYPILGFGSSKYSRLELSK